MPYGLSGPPPCSPSYVVVFALSGFLPIAYTEPPSFRAIHASGLSTALAFFSFLWSVLSSPMLTSGRN